MAAHFSTDPRQDHYDVVIIGGAIMGSSAAWHLSKNPDFDGTILVVERDPSYEKCSTAHTNSCMRQQFSMALNVQISQYAAAFVKDLRAQMGGDERVPELSIRSFGYLYLADNEAAAQQLKANHRVQVETGAATELLSAPEIAARYPFYHLDDIVLGSINCVDEGYWDGAAVFDAWRRQAREMGAEYIHSEVVDLTLSPNGKAVHSVVLTGGQVISCGQVINASGPRAARTAHMAGIELPVEPRKRYTWIFKAEQPLDRDLPLTIDPSGVHVRENGGGTYQCGGHSDDDPAVDYDDFTMDHALWQDHIWPILATRIPQFEAIKVQSEWAGHYAMNLLDHNAVLGPHPEVGNFLFMNGFSGHGLQQSPAMGRALAELITYGAYRSLDMAPFGFERIVSGTPIPEANVI